MIICSCNERFANTDDMVKHIMKLRHYPITEETKGDV